MGKLFDKHLKAVLNKNHPKQFTLTDGNGLGARVSSTGKVRWQYRYKIEGKSHRVDLGDYPEISLLKAREQGMQCRTWFEEGFDPKVKRSLERNKTLKPVTVKDALEYWLVEFAEENRANASKHRAQFAKHLYQYIGELPLDQTEMRHWLECFDRIKKGIKEKQKAAPVAAGYVLQNAKQALRFCRIRHYATSRVLDDLTITDVGSKQNKKDRVLNQQELIDIWCHANSKKPSLYFQRLLKLLIVFGARTQEVRLSTWDEWDFNEGVWTVPNFNSKTQQKIIRPIPKQLISWLIELKGNSKDSDFILEEFRSPESVSGSGGKVWNRLDHKEPWKLHDLRRTLATGMNDLGVAPHVVEQLLGHSLGGVMAIYNRSQYLSEKKAALEMWFDHLELLRNKPENVHVLSRVV
ncbi:site-specific integrase [Parashewanella spongiae]|uniref:Site-specific integrase n=1 Tax=Parashewanella spongiae TaxID=342950 RepID=A0A3A6TIH6_9GAMM|nr:site-specific integrase [Parashewanella spongiae]MCL1078812.1 tyrosine-type recombinase/integrase [Parashewanella spongiae]RJY11936.1 site-specific integrase [Parashewanella spongiae]